MSVSDINLNSLNSNQSTQQEEPIISLGQKYSEEEKQQAKENLQKNIKAGEDLLAMLEASISEYDNSMKNILQGTDKGDNIKLSPFYIGNSCLLFILFSIYSRLLNDLLFFNNSICFLAILFNLTSLSFCGIFISINSALIFSRLFNITK